MSIKSIVPVKVSLKTKMTQDGKSDHYHFEEDGQFVTLENGQHYLRYVEHQGSQATPVQFRLAPDEIHLVRSGAQKTHFRFANGSEHLTHYQTEYGRIALRVVTNRLDTDLNLAAIAGHVEIRYQLLMQDQLIGNYQIQLQFGA